MRLELFKVDAFTDQIFGGNPACVVPLKEWLQDEILLKIALENAVAETAFFVPNDQRFHLRWFTPEIEMDLCGHATLAAAHILKTELNYPEDELIFETLSGEMKVTTQKGIYTLNFPSRKPVPADLPEVIRNSLSIQPREVLKARDFVLVYNSEQDIINLEVDKQILDQINLDPGGIVVTAPGNNCDFVSRFFTPQASIFEDPVTGSAHCSLIPCWSERLKKKDMTAVQLSSRKGLLFCEDAGNRVLIGGKARTYLKGTLWF